MKKSVRIIMQGTVQGVFFRQFAKENSEKLNLKGFVRNLENGDVEIAVEGDNKNIDKLLDILKKGPKFAQIRNLNIEEKKYTGEFKDFKVLRF